MAAPAAGATASEAILCERPRISLIRYDEDYSFLRDPRCRTDPWDRLKYLPLTRRGSAHLTLGLDVRERFEHFSGFDWGGGFREPDDFLIQRVMPFADVRAGELQAFFQLTSNLVWGSDPRPLDRDDLDVLQAFVSMSFGPFTLRAGRQEVQYASSRLVSIREGPNVRLAFDGLRAILRAGEWEIDGLALLPVQVREGFFDDRSEWGQKFWGVYATGPALGPSLGLDFYYLGRFRMTAAFEQGTARELRHTVGARIWGEPARWDYNFELAYQVGTFGPGRIRAWMVASDTGYTLDLPAKPRIGAQANAFSGDSNPGSPDLQTFNPLFPRGAYFSQANLIGPLNLIDVHPGLLLRPFEALEITLDWDFFWRQSLGDGLYMPSTALQVPGAGNPERYVGSQGAVLVEWQITRHAGLGATWSHFFAGPFLRSAGFSDDVDFVGIWISYAI